MADNNTTKIDRWLKKSGWMAGSHLHRGMFLVSRPLPGGMLGASSREWRVAKIVRDDKDRRTIEVSENAHPLQNYARNELRERLAHQGVSPNSEPTRNLKGVRCFPYTVLD